MPKKYWLQEVEFHWHIMLGWRYRQPDWGREWTDIQVHVLFWTVHIGKDPYTLT